jgi:hypothetical protein
MSDWLKKHYGETEGPLGFPMTDRAAGQLDIVLQALPRSGEYEYRHLVMPKPPTELNPGERSDVSWISTESIDRMGEVVVSRGMNDVGFQANPIVTLGHSYSLPPVGRSLWRKRVKDGELVGIKAKTRYPDRPETWPASDPWPPDKVFTLIQAGLLQGKSIGFLPTKVHVPDDREYQKHGWPGGSVKLVIDEWLLLEYACVFLPANQDALVEQVAKGAIDLTPAFLIALGLNDMCLNQIEQARTPAVEAEKAVSFTPLAEIERAVETALRGLDLEALTRQAVERACEQRRGRV